MRPIKITADTRLQITAFALNAVNLGIRGYREIDGVEKAFGPHIFDITAAQATGAAVRSQVIPLGTKGTLVSVIVYVVTGSIQQGALYLRGEILNKSIDTTTPATVIFADTLSSSGLLGYPFSPIKKSMDGHGLDTTLNPTVPAGSTFYSQGLPVNCMVRIKAVSIRLVTDVTVANRQVGVNFIDRNGFEIAKVIAPDTQPANTTIVYSFSSNPIERQGTLNGVQSVLSPLPEVRLLAPLGAEAAIVYRTDNAQAADQMTVYADSEVWINPL